MDWSEFPKSIFFHQEPILTEGTSPMAKRGRKQKQLELIETLPENIQEIVDVAIEYRESVVERQAMLRKEVELKTKVKDMAIKAGLKRLPDGVIRFKYDGVLVSITPQDDKIKVKDVKEE